MSLSELIFWGSFLLVVHTYLLYPIVLFLAYSLVQIRRDWHYLRSRRDTRSPIQDPMQLPSVTLIIAAHNEEVRLPDKLENLRRLDYPRDRLPGLVASHRSTDPPHKN